MISLECPTDKCKGQLKPITQGIPTKDEKFIIYMCKCHVCKQHTTRKEEYNGPDPNTEVPRGKTGSSPGGSNKPQQGRGRGRQR